MNLAGLAGLAEVKETLQKAVRPASETATQAAAHNAATAPDASKEMGQLVAPIRERLADKMANSRDKWAIIRAKQGISSGELGQRSPSSHAATNLTLSAPQTPKSELATQKASGRAPV